MSQITQSPPAPPVLLAHCSSCNCTTPLAPLNADDEHPDALRVRCDVKECETTPLLFVSTAPPGTVDAWMLAHGWQPSSEGDEFDYCPEHHPARRIDS